MIRWQWQVWLPVFFFSSPQPMSSLKTVAVNRWWQVWKNQVLFLARILLENMHQTLIDINNNKTPPIRRCHSADFRLPLFGRRLYPAWEETYRRFGSTGQRYMSGVEKSDKNPDFWWHFLKSKEWLRVRKIRLARQGGILFCRYL